MVCTILIAVDALLIATGAHHADTQLCLMEFRLQRQCSYHGYSRGNKSLQLMQLCYSTCNNWFRITAGTLKMLQYSTKTDVTLGTKYDYPAAFVNNNRYTQWLLFHHYSLRLCLFVQSYSNVSFALSILQATETRITIDTVHVHKATNLLSIYYSFS